MKLFSSNNKKIIIGACALAANIIGAGILGLPYSFAQAGFFIGLFWIIILGTIILYTFLCLGEVALRTKEKMQLLGYAEKYLGKKYRFAMSFALLFGLYAALLAFLIGEGQSISYFFTNTTNNALFFSLLFWITMTLLLREGLRGLKKITTVGVFAVIMIISMLFLYYLHQITVENIFSIEINNIFLPFGIVLFALIGFNAIPELEMIMKGSEKKLKQAIILGILIPIILYIFFSVALVGALGKNISPIATIGLGKGVSFLGIFTMFTCYFVSSFCLKDLYAFDLKISRKKTFLLVAVPPLIAYLILYYTDKINFIQILGIGGVISGGLTGIIILIMNKKAKIKGDRKPEYVMPINWFIILLISLVFIAGIIAQLVLS
ncbi:MAG: aromatic amino acid transport family protein [Nanoarchaeota archaeon]